MNTGVQFSSVTQRDERQGIAQSVTSGLNNDLALLRLPFRDAVLKRNHVCVNH